MKFKVGDKVKYSGESWTREYIDLTGEIIKVESEQYTVKWSDGIINKSPYSYPVNYLEFVVSHINDQKLKQALGISGEDRKEKPQRAKVSKIQNPRPRKGKQTSKKTNGSSTKI